MPLRRAAVGQAQLLQPSAHAVTACNTLTCPLRAPGARTPRILWSRRQSLAPRHQPPPSRSPLGGAPCCRRPLRQSRLPAPPAGAPAAAVAPRGTCAAQQAEAKVLTQQGSQSRAGGKHLGTSRSRGAPEGAAVRHPHPITTPAPTPQPHLMTTSSPRSYLKKRMLSLSTRTARDPSPLPPLPPPLLLLLPAPASLAPSTSIGFTRRAEQKRSVQTQATLNHSSPEPRCSLCDIAYNVGERNRLQATMERQKVA